MVLSSRRSGQTTLLLAWMVTLTSKVCIQQIDAFGVYDDVPTTAPPTASPTEDPQQQYDPEAWTLLADYAVEWPDTGTVYTSTCEISPDSRLVAIEQGIRAKVFQITEPEVFETIAHFDETLLTDPWRYEYITGMSFMPDSPDGNTWRLAMSAWESRILFISSVGDPNPDTITLADESFVDLMPQNNNIFLSMSKWSVGGNGYVAIKTEDDFYRVFYTTDLVMNAHQTVPDNGDPEASIQHLEWFSDGASFCTAEETGLKVRKKPSYTWDVDRVMSENFNGSPRWLYCSVSPDMSVIAGGALDTSTFVHKLFLWDATTGDLLHEHDFDLSSLAAYTGLNPQVIGFIANSQFRFSPDGRFLAVPWQSYSEQSAGGLAIYRINETNDGMELLDTATMVSGTAWVVGDFDWSSDGKYVVMCGEMRENGTWGPLAKVFGYAA